MKNENRDKDKEEGSSDLKGQNKKPQKSKKQNRDQKGGKPSGPKQVKWPKEYAEFASHTTETSIARPLVLGAAKTTLRKALIGLLSVVMPTDLDDEFGDGAQNAYKIIKSLTSGARFYTETTLYAYRVVYRYLVVILARAYGLSQAVKATLRVSNAPNIAAYQMIRAAITENYDQAVQKITEYDHLILEMVSELNSLPTPSLGGLEDMFKYFAHVYRDDRGAASDYLVFVPDNVGNVVYDDSTKVMTSITMATITAENIQALATRFFAMVNALRDSIDINNLMADMLNALPSSRFDWMSMLKAHADFERSMTKELATSIASATMPLAAAANFGTLDSSGTRIAFRYNNIGARPSDFVFAAEDVVGQLVTTFGDASEVECYKFIMHDRNAGPGFTPAGSDPVTTTGLFIVNFTEITVMGSSVAAPTTGSLRTYFTNSNSTIQSTAEDGGKSMALMYANVQALPKVDLTNYGTAGSDDNLLWKSENVKRVAVADILNNVKALNLLAYSTVHLSTEKER